MLCGLLALLGGCAAYQAKPLHTQPDTVRDLSGLVVDASSMPLPELASHRFDPSDGLDFIEVGMLAVANNPDLRLARDDAGISRAQAFAAGLLPDPQFGISRDFPTNGGPGNTSAFGLGLSYDVGAVLTRSASRSAAAADVRKVDLSLLWQEWQVVASANVLFVRARAEEALLGLLQQERALFEERYRQSQKALADGNTTLDAEAANLAALQDVLRLLNELNREHSQTLFDLRSLLGLAANASLPLVGEVGLRQLDGRTIDHLIAELPKRRPDLLALQAGYQAQEEHYRVAVLAQFPMLNVGVTRARDTSGLYSSGFTLALTLPTFNRNRGNIVIQKATRQRLHDEYQMRINAATAEVQRAVANQQLLEAQLRDVDVSLPELQSVAQSAEQAYRHGDLDVLAYTNLEAALISKRIESVRLSESIMEQRILLRSLLGNELAGTSTREGAGA